MEKTVVLPSMRIDLSTRNVLNQQAKQTGLSQQAVIRSQLKKLEQSTFKVEIKGERDSYSLYVKCIECKKLSECSFLADNVEISTYHPIQEVKKVS